MMATQIGLDIVRKLAVETGAVNKENRLITEPDVVDPLAVIVALVELIKDYEATSY